MHYSFAWRIQPTVIILHEKNPGVHKRREDIVKSMISIATRILAGVFRMLLRSMQVFLTCIILTVMPRVHRRSFAYSCLGDTKRAQADLEDLAHKTQEDQDQLGYLEMELTAAAGLAAECNEEWAGFKVVRQHTPHRKPGQMDEHGRVMVPDELKWVEDLPAQKPARDKTGGVMPGRSEPFLDDDAEAGCTLDDILRRTGLAGSNAASWLWDCWQALPVTGSVDSFDMSVSQ